MARNTASDDVFESLQVNDIVDVTVSATGGELKPDDEWIDTLRYVGEQDLGAQSRKESHEFERVDDGKPVYLRFDGDHKNNFGFVMSERDTSEIDYDALWQNPIEDDREWTVSDIEV